MPLPRRLVVILVSIAVGQFPGFESAADDWPQILGPNRNGMVPNLRTVQGWTTDTPNINWQYPLGDGYAGPVVIKNQIIVFHRIAGKERIESIDHDSGRSNWKRDFDAYYRGGVNPDLGPRCVPLVVDEKVIVYGAAGVCHAVKLHGGGHLWSRDLAADYNAPDGYFGAGSSPLHINGTIVLNVGGEKGSSGIVGLDAETGKTIWTSTNEGASYSSPIIIKRQNAEYVFAVARMNAVLLNPTDGEVIFSTPFGKRGPTVNAATPLLIDEDRVFLTASYGIGAELLQLNERSSQKLWASDSSLSSQYNTPVYERSHIYGIHGREDSGVAELRCIDANNGQVAWKKTDFGVANLLIAGQTVIAITGDGQIVLFEATPTKYVEIGRSRFSNDEVRAIPAVSKDRLYVRDSKQLFSIQIGR